MYKFGANNFSFCPEPDLPLCLLSFYNFIFQMVGTLKTTLWLVGIEVYSYTVTNSILLAPRLERPLSLSSHPESFTFPFTAQVNTTEIEPEPSQTQD